MFLARDFGVVKEGGSGGIDEFDRFEVFHGNRRIYYLMIYHSIILLLYS